MELDNLEYESVDNNEPQIEGDMIIDTSTYVKNGRIGNRDEVDQKIELEEEEG